MKGFINQVGGYFNNNKSGGQGVSTHNIPQQHNIRGRTIQEEKILSEGGFGYIWRAYDVNTREVFALKRMICQGQDRVQIAKRELRNFEMLPNHPNITKFYGGSIIPTNEGCTALFLMELCDGGSLFDLMSQTMPNKIPERKLIHIIYEAAKGIRALHLANPPITHRDIKIENILQSGGVYKLCDFGSCSTQNIDFRNVQKSQYEQYEDLFNQSTTLMYRPPEMCDPSKKMLVDTKVDIWMLGCVLYTIAFYIHPFIDSSKIAIVDANFRFPQDSQFSKKLHDFIRHMITPDPSFRPSIHDVIQICENYDRVQTIQLNPVAQSLKEKEEAREREEKKFEQNGRGIKKFDGDIPIEELMKLQQKIKATHLNDEEDEDNSCTFIKKKQTVPSKQNQKTEKQLEQIRQQLQKPASSSSSSQSQQRQNVQQSGNNQTIQNEFWGFSAPQSNNTQQQNKSQNNNNQKNQVQDPFSQFGFGTSNNSSNQVSNPFDNFNFNQNNNNSNSNSVFDQFGFQNNNNNSQNNFNSNNQGNFNSNNQKFNSANNLNSNNNQNNVWEFYENSNDNSQNKLNSNNSLGQQTLNQYNQNQQYSSNSGINQQQQYQSNNQKNDPFAQFGSNNQNFVQNQVYQPSNFNQQQQLQQQQKQQQQPVNLLDLDDEIDNKSNNNQGAVNLLDLGLEL